MKNRYLNFLLIPVLCLMQSSVQAQSSAKQRRVKKTVGELLAQATQENRGGQTQLQKGKVVLPSAQLKFQTSNNASQIPVDLNAVRPTRSSDIVSSQVTGLQADYERILDKQIDELYKITQKFKNSPNRGELWVRLAELYVEKATLINSRVQDEYDKKLVAYNSGKMKKKPVADNAAPKEFNKKAIQLYEWFVRDFPQDEKMPQALYFLGFGHFELGDSKKGANYYEQLTQRYPQSPFVGEAHFALGEYYFELEKWNIAYKEYSHLIKEKRHRLYTFSLYKGAWCLFRLGRYKDALSYMEFIVKSNREDKGGQLANKKYVNRAKLESEALRDIVVFYVQVEPASKAFPYFRNIVPGDAFPYLEKLAYYYSDRGDKESARIVFRGLIEEKPTNPKAFEYQYQVVQNYFYQKNSPQFKEELYRWIRNFGQESSWYKANANNKTLIDNGLKLQETTLRNYILQNHQNAQDSRVSFVQSQANEGYLIYIKEFPNSPLIGDMHFYYGELLYDMKRYEDSAVQYRWVVENASTSKFYDKSAQNLILAFERTIPKDEEFQKRIGTSLNPVPLDPQSKKFIENAEWYLQKFPSSDRATEIKFRIGRIYYQSNQFDKAEGYFKEIVKTQPNSKYAEYSANLLLDIFNLKKDYVGLEKAGHELLALPSMNNSKAGQEIRGVIERANFKKAQDLEGQKKYAESAQQFEVFAQQNPKSTLVSAALYNAAVNYERSGNNSKALKNYQVILASSSPEAAKLKPKVSRFVAKLNQDSGQFEEAAKIYRQLYKENPQDPMAANYLYNSAILYEALGKDDEALRGYNEYTQKSKRLADTADALFSMATLYRKRKQFALASSAYRDYVNLSKLDERSVEASYHVYDIALRQNQRSLSEEWKQKTLGMNRRLGGVAGAQYAAKIKLHDADLIYQELKAVKIPQNPQKQKAAVDRKLDALKRLNGEIANVIKLNSAEEIVDALFLLGEANQHIYQSFVTAPLPEGYSDEDIKKYKAGVEQAAQPFAIKAKESYKSCVERGQELEAYNDRYHSAYQIMTTSDPKKYYSRGEQGSQTYFVNWMTK